MGDPVIRCFRLVLAALALGALLAAPALAVPREGDAAPPFKVGDAKGGSLTSAAYRGKPLYLNFFASWCVPCNEEAPSVAALYAKYHRRGLAIVGVNELENASKALGFAHRYKWPFAIAVDDGAMGGTLGVIGLPVHIFIDKNGKISTYRLGQMDPPDIEAAIRKII